MSDTAIITTTATVTKSVLPRARIDQLTTERRDSDDPDTFENVIPPTIMDDMGPRVPEFPTPEEAARLAPSVQIDLPRLAKRSQFDEKESTLLSTWMGHASFFVQVDGVNVLTDPVFSERASPSQTIGPKRFVPVPCKIEELPRVDIVTISHNHYDHLDTDTVEILKKLFNPIFVVPLGMKSRWFTTLGWEDSEVQNRVVELGWYKTIEINFPSRADEGSSPQIVNEQKQEPSAGPPTPAKVHRIVQVTHCPAQHWSQRGAMDRNMELWGSFVVEHYRSKSPQLFCGDQVAYPGMKQSNETASPFLAARWFHSGDTGYNEKYFLELGKEFGKDDGIDVQCTVKKDEEAQEASDKEERYEDKNGVTENEKIGDTAHCEVTTANKRPVFDLALLPIGAYDPRSANAQQHVTPDESVVIFHEIGKAKLAIGMHYATFILTDEPIDEPARLLKESCVRRKLPDGVFVAPKHGESFTVSLRSVADTKGGETWYEKFRNFFHA